MSDTDENQTMPYGARAISDKNTIYVNYFVYECKNLFAGDIILSTYTKAGRFCYEFGSSRLRNHFVLTFGIWPRKLFQVERLLTLLWCDTSCFDTLCKALKIVWTHAWENYLEKICVMFMTWHSTWRIKKVAWANESRNENCMINEMNKRLKSSENCFHLLWKFI